MFKKILVPCVAIGVASLLGATSARAADESTKVGGKVYADLTSISAKDAAGDKTDASGTGYDLKRVYLTFDHTFDDMWSANVTTDMQYSSAVGATELYIKKAYLQAKFSDALVLRAGSTDLPWVPFVEGIYGYRFLENVMVDRMHFGTSADWGLHLSGKGGEMFNYALSVVDGAGYKKPLRSKSMDVEGRAAITPIDGLTVAVGMYTGKLGAKKESVPTEHTANRFDALVAYVNSGMRLGAEYFMAKNWTTVTSLSTDKADGFSVWASYDFSPMWGVFARADSTKPSKDLNPGVKDQYFNAGFVSHPRKGVDIAVAYKHDKLKQSTGSPKTDEIGVWGQLAF